MKRAEYTLKDFKIVRIIAIVFSILYFITRSLFVLSEAAEIPVVLEVPVFVCDMFLPFLIVASWYMCYERYMYLEKSAITVENQKSICRQIKLNIAVMSLVGVATFLSSLNVVTYISWYWRYLANLSICIVILVSCAVGWGIYLVKSVLITKSGCLRKSVFRNKRYIGVAVILLVGSLLCTIYAYNKGESAWYDNLIEMEI